MIAEEHEPIAIEEEDTPEPEDGLEEMNRAGVGPAWIHGIQFAVRVQPGELVPLGAAGQEALDGQALTGVSDFLPRPER